MPPPGSPSEQREQFLETFATNILVRGFTVADAIESARKAVG